MDFIFLKIWIRENSGKIRDKKFKKFYCNDKKYILEFQQHFFNISIISGDSICFFSNERPNEKEETPFTKIISQHLNKTFAGKISIEKNDKVISIFFQKKDIYGINIRYRLIFELINRYENIIFARESEVGKWIILDAYRKVNFSENRFRQILAGTEYKTPPNLKKPYILDFEKEEFINFIGGNLPENWKDFSKNFSNIPKFFHDEFSPKISSEKFWDSVSNLDNKIYFNPEKKYFTLIKKNEFKNFETTNKAFKYYFEKQTLNNIFLQLKNNILQKMKKQAQKIEKVIKNQTKEFEQLQNYEKWKKFGELLKVNLKKIRRGQKKILVKDYFSENNSEIAISLNDEWNAEKNMEYYFKKYKKAKSGKAKLEKHLLFNKARLQRVLENISEVENCKHLDELKKWQVKKFTKKKSDKKRLFRRISYEFNGIKWEIFIGRNRKENDILTTKFAKSEDWFFHSRIFHGAHIVLRNPKKMENPPEKVKLMAARIAAHFSKAKHSKYVPVDFTKIKYVSKPRKSPAGFVIYKNQKTLFVNPTNPQKL